MRSLINGILVCVNLILEANLNGIGLQFATCNFELCHISLAYNNV